LVPESRVSSNECDPRGHPSLVLLNGHEISVDEVLDTPSTKVF